MRTWPAGGPHRGARLHQLQGHRGLQADPLDAGARLLQALNILENFDLQAMGYNSARYTHALYQAMNLAFADRDFYYGDPRSTRPRRSADCSPRSTPATARPPSTGSATTRTSGPATRTRTRADEPVPRIPGRVAHRPARRRTRERHAPAAAAVVRRDGGSACPVGDPFYRGTTTVQAADAEGWVVSVTPSGGWIPAVIAGRTGDRPQPARAELRARPRRQPVQRGGARASSRASRSRPAWP
jgi:gamma-glutamyltranspeptidase / glutathione hydrolase